LTYRTSLDVQDKLCIEYASMQVVQSRRAWIASENLIGANPMIEFPNHSRSYDHTRRPYGFGGDSALERHFIDEAALRNSTRCRPDDQVVRAYSLQSMRYAPRREVYIREVGSYTGRSKFLKRKL
jgi:hypothetical protein